MDLKFSHPDYVVAIATLPNGHIATGCRDENIRIWDPSLEKCIKVIKGHFGEVSHLASGAGGTLWSGSLDSTIRTWDLTNPELGQDPDPNDHVQETFVPMTKEEEEALEELMK